MKKVLLGTSAIALAGAFANTANAVEWEMAVGGYMEQYVGYANVEVDGLEGEWDGVDEKSESEIHFKPSITLDNGIKIGADVQLEGNTSSDTIDESFLFVDGAFGRVLLGSENSAGYLMSYGAPDVTFMGVNSGSLPAFVPFTGSVVGTVGGIVGTLNTGDNFFRGTLGSTFLENAGNNDAQRMTYFTPRFAGFQVGLSYARDGREDDPSQVNTDLELSNIFDVGANYVNSFGGIDVAVSGRWGIADGIGNDTFDLEENPQVWAAGMNLGFAGFTVGGSFGEQNNAGVADGQGWDAGVAYETGPWGFSFTYFNGENVDNEQPFLGAKEEAQQYLVGASYALAKGVALNAFGAYANFDEEAGDVFEVEEEVFSVNPGGDDVDGWVVGTGIKISF